jgi:hypothetical protein
MTAKRAWVISVELLDAAAHVRAAEMNLADRSLCRVLALLGPRMPAREVKDRLRLFNGLLWLTVDEERDMIAARGNGKDRLHSFINNNSDVVIGLMHGQYHLSAHLSTIKVVQEAIDGDYVTWQPDSYTTPRVDPETHHVVELTRHDFAEKRARKIDIDVSRFLL